jgi:hypothetical protein
VPEDVTTALLEIIKKDPSRLASGGKWEYSYAIGQSVMDQALEGLS